MIREERTQPLLGPIKSRIPGLAQQLPEAELPTRTAPPMREAPLLRQTTGISLNVPKNPLERELDRLGLTRGVVQPSTGDPEADRLIGKHMGPLAEQMLVPLVQLPVYQRLSDAGKEGVLRAALDQVRAKARELAIQEDPKRFLAIRMQGLPGWQQRLLKERGVPSVR